MWVETGAGFCLDRTSELLVAVGGQRCGVALLFQRMGMGSVMPGMFLGWLWLSGQLWSELQGSGDVANMM